MTEDKNSATEVVGIRFRGRGKMYYFDPDGLTLRDGDRVVVETAKGLEMGDVVKGCHLVDSASVIQPLRPVVRIATEDDLRIEELCRKREREAYVIGKQKIKAHGLDMKLVDVECSFEGNKILFFFSSDGRVDFRELVKDLAGVFRTRIELRQIGVRDEARMLGGLGICGRPFCCGCFIDEFAPVSTKMAKTQSMSLNPSKISGCCGRLMCCLRYEQPAYEELVKNVPKNGAFVETPDGYGNVTQVNVLRQLVKVKLDGQDADLRTYEAEDVAAIPGGRPRDGSQPPHVLVLRSKKPREAEPEEESGWVMPERLITAPEELAAGAERHETAHRSGGRNRSRREEPHPGTGGETGGRNAHRPHGAKPAQPGKGEQPQGKKREGEKSGSTRHRNKKRGGKPHPGTPAQPAGEVQKTAAGGETKEKSGYERRRRRPRSSGGGNTSKQGGEGA
ncbi:MAG: hypothetical protein IKD79_02985 [Oscillospiraceae bacterium]|nr:hypothetical protein [Oscillospiraceae bacterium]